MREQAIKEAERLFNDYYELSFISRRSQAKEIALMDVQNSIDAIDQAGTDAERNFVDDTYRFYEMVKEEIDKL